jgi:hypothetical protein
MKQTVGRDRNGTNKIEGQFEFFSNRYIIIQTVEESGKTCRSVKQWNLWNRKGRNIKR